MSTIYEKFLALPIDRRRLLCLEPGEITDPYFCYPVDTEPIGFEGNILYCLLPEYVEAIFACNPESCADNYVYPLAESFEDFMRLILACGSANPIEQIVWTQKPQFEQQRQEERERRTAEQQAALALIERELHIAAMERPYEYVKRLQADFDYGRIQFSAEYYDALGIER